jgi:Tol biopolymer transport system component
VSLSPSTRIGPYEIVAALGVGGMGEVYRATDMKLKRQVALKVLPSALNADPDRLTRFQREAEVLASLNHPNIAQIYGLEGQEGQEGLRAIVMELVEGPTLADRIALGPIRIEEALSIAMQITEAIEAAHELGIVHRDLKPANIKVREDGTVKVLDFGLAKALDSTVANPNVTNSPTLTMAAMTGAGVILGTAAYMSPEQARGRVADKRSDIWAFGCVLYEMLAGKRAFSGEDVTDIIAAVVRDEPDWSAFPGTVPDHIRLLLRRCLEKDRKKRISEIGTARFLIAEPIAALAQPSSGAISAASHRSGWKRAAPYALAVIALGATVATTVWTTRPAVISPPVGRFAVSLGDGQNFTNTGRRLIAISPDGQRFVYVANSQLYLRELGTLAARPLAGTMAPNNPAGITSPVFSPDSRSVAFYSMADSTLKRLAVADGATAVTVCPADNPFGISWDDNGIVFGQGNKGVLRVSPEGGKPETIATVATDEYAASPQLLPDGKTVLFAVAKGTAATRWEQGQVVVQPVGSGNRKTLIEGGAEPRLLPTGHLLYTRGGVMYSIPFDRSRLVTTGQPVAVVEGVRRATSGAFVNANSAATSGVAQFSASNTGTLAYVPGPASIASGEFDLALVDRDGTLQPLNLPAGGYAHTRMSPDGHRVVFEESRNNEANIYVYALGSRTTMERRTFGGHNRYPIWTADGKRIVFQSDREGDLGIFWQAADGSGTAERLIKAEERTALTPESWSPHNDSFLYTMTKENRVTLWVYSLRDRKSTRFDNVESQNPVGASFSPDGRWVAYGAESSISVQPFPPTSARYQLPKATGAHHPFWSASGKELFYEPGINQLAVVPVVTEPSFAFGNPVTLPGGSFGSTNPAASRNRDIGPEGKGFITPVPVDRSQTEPELREIRLVLNWFEELNARVPVK